MAQTRRQVARFDVGVWSAACSNRVQEVDMVISLKQVKELGNVIQDRKLQRSNDDQTTIADLTGVAVQDIQITKAVYQYFNQ